MMMVGERVAAAARGLVGVRFRLHGRDERGLDCVGLVALAAEMAGCGFRDVPTGYGLRGGDARVLAGMLDGAGLVRARKDRVGDVLLVRSGPGQFHVLVRSAVTGAGAFVHAHAGLRRVVEMPGPLGWILVGRWRF